MRVALYQQVNSPDPLIYSREYRVKVDLDFMPESFYPIPCVESKILSSYYDVELAEMGIMLEEFTPADNEAFELFCKTFEKLGWKQIG